MTRWALCVVVLVAVPLLSAQQSDSFVEIKTGFVTGQTFLQMNSAEQGSYAPGVVDGIFLAPLFGAPKEKLLRVERCIVGMTNSQVAALLVAHLKAHPEEWHQSAHGSMYRALKERCPVTVVRAHEKARKSGLGSLGFLGPSGFLRALGIP